jgi:hypothetical protein
MADKPHKRTSGKKAPVAVETSLSIEEQTRAFLEAGGKVEKINSGISGQPSMAPQKPATSAQKPATTEAAKPEATDSKS